MLLPVAVVPGGEGTPLLILWTVSISSPFLNIIFIILRIVHLVMRNSVTCLEILIFPLNNNIFPSLFLELHLFIIEHWQMQK